MEKLLILGDLQIKSNEPYSIAFNNFIDWMKVQSFNNDNNILLQLGDLYDSSLPDPKTNQLVLKFFNNLKFKKIYILQGNHEFNGVSKQSSLDILKEFNKNIEIITNIKILDIGNLKCLCLPYFYPSQNDINIYNFYNNLSEEYYLKDYDFIFHHLEDENNHFGKKYVDLSKLKGDRIAGHIHIATNDYIGTPFPTRYDEKDQKGKIIEIAIESKEKIQHNIPMFINYIDIEYPNDLVFNSEGLSYFTIKNAIDYIAAKDYYINKYKEKTLYFRKISLKKLERTIKEIKNSDLKQKDSINTFFNNFSKQNKLSDSLQKRCKIYLDKIK